MCVVSFHLSQVLRGRDRCFAPLAILVDGKACEKVLEAALSGFLIFTIQHKDTQLFLFNFYARNGSS